MKVLFYNQSRLSGRSDLPHGERKICFPDWNCPLTPEQLARGGTWECSLTRDTQEGNTHGAHIVFPICQAVFRAVNIRPVIAKGRVDVAGHRLGSYSTVVFDVVNMEDELILECVPMTSLALVNAAEIRQAREALQRELERFRLACHRDVPEWAGRPIVRIEENSPKESGTRYECGYLVHYAFAAKQTLRDYTEVHGTLLSATITEVGLRAKFEDGYVLEDARPVLTAVGCSVVGDKLIGQATWLGVSVQVQLPYREDVLVMTANGTLHLDKVTEIPELQALLPESSQLFTKLVRAHLPTMSRQLKRPAVLRDGVYTPSVSATGQKLFIVDLASSREVIHDATDSEESYRLAAQRTIEVFRQRWSAILEAKILPEWRERTTELPEELQLLMQLL